MNKFHTYFGQNILDTEMNEIFDSFASAIEQFIQDFGYSGLAAGGVVTQHTPNNLTVDVGAPTVVYDQAGNRMTFGAPATVDCSLDEVSAATAVSGGGNEKWLSIFIKFTSTPTDPRTDDLGAPTFFRYVAGYQLRVAQGSEAPVGTATRVALRGDQILLADVKLIHSQTTIVNADISTTRAQTIYQLTGSPLAIQAKDLSDVLQQMLTAINGVSTGTLIVPTLTGSPVTLTTGTVDAVLAAFLAAFNTRATIVDAMQLSGGDVEYVTPVARTRLIGPYKLMSTDISGAGTQIWKLPSSPDTSPYVYCDVNNGMGLIELNDLPVGATLTRVRVRALKGDAVAQMTATLLKRTGLSFTLGPVTAPSNTVVATGTSSGGAGEVVWQVGTVNETITGSDCYAILIEATGGAAAANDFFYGVQLIFNDPGPGGR